tara:strand:- start:62 stop:541 length:480 start_codon:yes stop_codon:yes gene_type:complete
MNNELSDPNMIIKKKSSNTITFQIKDTIDIIWMSQKTLSIFFEVPFKTIITALKITLDDIQTHKKNHIRTISYVKNQKTSPQSIQETQYSFYIISWLAFKLDSPIAKAFQQWVIESHYTLSKNGFLLQKKRIIKSEKRLKKFQHQVNKLNSALTDQQSI